MADQRLLRCIKIVYSIGCNVPFITDSYSEEVKKFSVVLRKIDISTFFYIRINRDSQFFILSDNKEISGYLLNKSRCVGTLLEELAKTAISGKIAVSLWSGYPEDSFLQKIYQLGIGNGISIALPFNSYIDIFSFASSIQKTEINNFYLNHLRLLKRFIIFFRLKAKKIIFLANNNLHSLNKKIELYGCSKQQEKSKALNILRETISPKKVAMKAICCGKIVLTKRETRYLIMLLDGKSMNAIAAELGVSRRSVESRLETLKSKTGYNTKADLLSAFLDSQIYQPSIHYDRYY